MNRSRSALAAVLFVPFACAAAFGQATIFRVDPDGPAAKATKVPPPTFSSAPKIGFLSNGGGAGGGNAAARGSRFPRRSGSAFESAWHLEVTPYLWMPKIEGNLRLNNQLVRIDSSASNLAGSLDFIIGTRVEAKYGKWGLFVDEDYMNLGATGTAPGPLATVYNVQPTLNIFEVGPSFTAFAVGNTENGDPMPDVFTIEVLGGMRWTHLGLGLTTATTQAEGSRNIIDGFVGARVRGRPHPRFMLGGGYTIGGGGSRMAWTANFTGDFQFHRNMSFSGGYQVLDMDADDTNNVVGFNGRLRGLIFGFTFHH